MEHKKEIDGIRAIAVLSVVCYHAAPGHLPGGFIGVDIFFVLSGYLITGIILERLKIDSFSVCDFIQRRIRRLFPALILVLFASLSFGWFGLFPAEYEQLGKHLASSAAFILNFVLSNEAGYFDNLAETKPLLHLWSLAVEEQFYFLWPLLLLIFFKRNLSIVTLILLLGFISFYFNISLVYNQPEKTFFYPLGRFWELLAGGLLSWFSISYEPSKKQNVKANVNRYLYFVPYYVQIRAKDIVLNTMSITGFILLAFGFLFITQQMPYPGWWSTIPVLGTMLLIQSGSSPVLNRFLLMNPIAVTIGLMSYPLYLWHWPLLSFLRIVKGEIPSKETRVIAVLLALVLAWLTWKLIETPIRRRKPNRKLTLTLVAGMLILGLSGLFIDIMKGFQNRKMNNVFSEANEQLEGPKWAFTQNDYCMDAYEFPGTDEFAWWFCVKSSSEKPTTMLLGNSYANQYYPGLTKLASFKDETVLHIGTCEFGGGDYEGVKFNHPCLGQRQAEQLSFLHDIIENTDTLKTVIISGLNENPSNEYIDRTLGEISYLSLLLDEIIVFLPHLRIGFDPKLCISRPFRASDTRCTFTKKTLESHRAQYQELSAALQKHFPKIMLYDPTSILCQDSKCSYSRNGIPLYRDDGHLSAYGSYVVATDYMNWHANQNLK